MRVATANQNVIEAIGIDISSSEQCVSKAVATVRRKASRCCTSLYLICQQTLRLWSTADKIPPRLIAISVKQIGRARIESTLITSTTK